MSHPTFSLEVFKVNDSLGEKTRLQCLKTSQKLSINNKKRLSVRTRKLFNVLANCDTEILLKVIESNELVLSRVLHNLRENYIVDS